MFIGFLIDRRKNAQRSDEEYETDYIYSGDINRMMVGIKALHKRGVNLDKYRPLVLKQLIGDSKGDRVMGRMILKSCYPDDFKMIKGFVGSKKIEECIEIVKPLLDKYGIEIPEKPLY